MCINLLFRWFSGENCIIFTFSLHKLQHNFGRLKKNMNDGIIVFLMSLLIVLT